MKKLLWPILAIFLTAFLAIAVSAQGLTETFIFNDGSTVNYPQNWAAEVDENGFLHLRSEATDIIFIWYYADNLANFNIRPNDYQAVFEATFQPSNPDITFDAQQVQSLMLDGRSMGEYLYEDSVNGDPFERLLIAVPLDSGGVVIASALPINGHDITEKPIIRAIASTLTAPTVPTLTQSYVTDTGIIFPYPENWEFSVQDDGLLNLRGTQTDVVLSFFAPQELINAGYTSGADDFEAILEDVFLPKDQTITFSDGEFTEINFNGERFGQFEYVENDDGDRYTRLMLITLMDDGTAIVAGVIPLTGNVITERNTVLAIMSSAEVPGVGFEGIGLPFPNGYVFGDGTRLVYPDEWRLVAEEEYFVGFETDDMLFGFRLFDAQMLAYNDLTSTDLLGILEKSFNPRGEPLTFNVADTRPILVGNRPVLQHQYTEYINDTSYIRTRFAFSLDDETAMLVVLTPYVSGQPPLENYETALQVIEAIQAP